jgi:hypothetical protein
MKNTTLILILAASMLAMACGDTGTPEDAAAPNLDVTDGDVTKVEPGKADSSAEAVFVDMTFDGELLASSSFNPKRHIDEQLLYTIGHLNGDRAVGRLDKVVLTNVKTAPEGDNTLISYTASIQVAWGSKTNVPSEYKFMLPRDVTFSGLEEFTKEYNHDCVDFGAHDVDTGSMWYYYRPNRRGCEIAAGHIVTASADVVVSPVNTTGKYPEYHKVWEDGVLNVVAVFGKYEDGKTTDSDAGIAAYNRFHSSIQSALSRHGVTTTPEDLSSRPGVDAPEIRYEAMLDADHRVVVTAMLVDNIRTAPRAFNDRYSELSKDADLVVYNGHAGLGANIRALARKGSWVEGQYAIIFMNGCDTYAYVDSALFDAHADVNEDDDKGTKYADLVTNALPSFFRSMPHATMALVKGLMSFKDPQTYEQMFRDIDSSQVILVSGEEDNVFVPGMDDDITPVDSWSGLSLGGTVAKNEEIRFETPELPAGTYTFLMEGSGDADLYVRIGSAPDQRKFDCRPFKASSTESCQVEITSPTIIHGMVRGWNASSDFDLVGSGE